MKRVTRHRAFLFSNRGKKGEEKREEDLIPTHDRKEGGREKSLQSGSRPQRKVLSKGVTARQSKGEKASGCVIFNPRR